LREEEKNTESLALPPVTASDPVGQRTQKKLTDFCCGNLLDGNPGLPLGKETTQQ
jgi:hypothetical protein